VKILLVTPYYAPDLGPSAPMFALLSEELVRRGHRVTVLCAVPHFPSGYVSNEYHHGLWKWDTHNGVQVCRVRVPSGDRTNLRHRLWVFLVYQFLVTLVGLRVRYDMALVTNPAIETFLPFFVLCWLRRKPCLYAVWDVYPEVGVRMGVFKNQNVIRLVSLLEDFCLRRATRIQVLSDGFVAALASHQIAPDRIAVIPHWLDTAFIHPLPRQNSFSGEHALDGYFVVLYAGNIGLSQGLETILEAARILKDQPDIVFMFVGEGAGKAQLEKQAVELTNVRFLPFQPRERLPEVLACADISLVVLKQGIGLASLPSKLFSILASGRPVLASVDDQSDTCQILYSSQAGLCVDPESPKQFADAVLYLRNAPSLCIKMGGSGRALVEKVHSPQSAAECFDDLLNTILGD
jgi:colanic acid biosynthesis glycosyl transferase WcaI